MEVGTVQLLLIDSLRHRQEGNPTRNLYDRTAVLIADELVLRPNRNYLQKLASVPGHHQHLMKNSRICLRMTAILSFQSRALEQVQNDRQGQQAMNVVMVAVHSVVQANMTTNDAE